MKELFATLNSISESTGLKIELYSSGGMRLFFSSASNLSYTFSQQVKSEMLNDVYLDRTNNVTVFESKNIDGNTFGVIQGCDEISKNYAVIIKKLVESHMQNKVETKEKTQEQKFRLYLCDELNAMQCESLKSNFFTKSFSYYALGFFTETKKDFDSLYDFLTTIADKDDILTAMDDTTIAYFKRFSRTADYSSASEFANVLYENITEEIRKSFYMSIGGNVSSFEELKDAYSKALFAYNAGKKFNPESMVYSYKEYAIMKLFAQMPKEQLTEYLDMLLDKNNVDIFKNSELTQTADMFLKNSLNIAETSRIMYLHRNTLIYRIDKIESITGLNIRNFNDAMTFRMATLVYKYLKK